MVFVSKTKNYNDVTRSYFVYVPRLVLFIGITNHPINISTYRAYLYYAPKRSVAYPVTSNAHASHLHHIIIDIKYIYTLVSLY